jgi:hypothetical protein
LLCPIYPNRVGINKTTQHIQALCFVRVFKTIKIHRQAL